VTEKYLTPDPDDTEGHVRREYNEAGTDDDTQGHFKVREDDDADTTDDDTEGHVRH
jgi:hypothetical protein